MKHTIDGKGKRIGRVASEAAMLLMGKKSTDFARNKKTEDSVEIVNAHELSIPLKKQTQKIYLHYSGYPGGKKEERMEEVIKKKGYAEVLRKAVYGMLPANKTRKKLMKQLEVKE